MSAEADLSTLLLTDVIPDECNFVTMLEVAKIEDERVKLRSFYIDNGVGE